MTAVDWGLLVFITVFLVRGFVRGFLLEIFEIIAIAAGYFVARFAGPSAGLFISDHSPLQRFWAGIIAASLLFLITAIAVGLIGKLLRKIVRKASLGWVDRLAGSVIGLLKAFIFILLLMLMVSFVPLPNNARAKIENGYISRYFWLAAGMTLDKMKMTPVSPSRVLASFLRSYGLNDEVVHIVTDQPDLMHTLLSNAPVDINLPLKSIMAGEPATKMPSKLNFSGDVSSGLVEMLENPKLNDEQKSQIFWTMIKKAQ